MRIEINKIDVTPSMVTRITFDQIERKFLIIKVKTTYEVYRFGEGYYRCTDHTAVDPYTAVMLEIAYKSPSKSVED